LRRIEEEREVLRRLRDELNLVPGRRVDLDGTDAIRFASKLRGWQQGTGDEAHAAIFDARPLRARLGFEDGVFDVVFECEQDGDETATAKRAEAATVIRAWRDGLELVPSTGRVGAAPGGLVGEARTPRRGPSRGARRRGKLQRAALPELGALWEALVSQAPGAREARTAGAGLRGIPRAAIPAGVTASLRHYQEHGYDWLAFLRDAELGAVLADDMGLGKTLQTICALRGRCLVICPKSVVYNWIEEIARFRRASAPRFTMAPSGSSRPRPT